MTSCKEAIKDLEVDGKVAADMEDVRLCPIANMKPLIAKMDNSLSGLKKCKQLRELELRDPDGPERARLGR